MSREMEAGQAGECYSYSFSEDFLFKEILPRAPSKSIARFKSVSKAWLLRLSTDNTFIADHIDHNSAITLAELCGVTRADYLSEGSLTTSPRRLFFVGRHGSQLAEIDTSYIRAALSQPTHRPFQLSLIGSCNGLLCIGLRFDDSEDPGELVVWNPLTGEFKCFAEPSGPRLEGVDYYFGFDKESNDYKVVRIGNVLRPEDVHVQILALRSCRWRRLTAFSGYAFAGGLTLDGDMHWAVFYKTQGREGLMFEVLSFDLSSEDFRMFEGPICPSNQDCNYIGLVQWKGVLGAVSVSSDWKEWRLWLKTKSSEEDDGGCCWTMTKMAIDISSHPPISFCKILGDQLVLECSVLRKCFVYDLNTRETRELEGGLSDVWSRDLFDHTHTLVSPNSS